MPFSLTGKRRRALRVLAEMRKLAEIDSLSANQSYQSCPICRTYVWYRPIAGHLDSHRAERPHHWSEFVKLMQHFPTAKPEDVYAAYLTLFAVDVATAKETIIGYLVGLLES